MKPLHGKSRFASNRRKPNEKTLEEQARQYASAFHRGAIRSGISARTKLYRATHGEFSLPKPSLSKGKAIFLLVLLGLGGLFIGDQALKFTTGTSPLPFIDPIKPLWYDSPQSSTTFDVNWNTKGGANWVNGGANPEDNYVLLDANSTYSAVAISEQAIELSTAVSKTLELWQRWEYHDLRSNFGQFAFFLTRNSTVPIEDADWEPNSDRDVVWIMRQLTTFTGNSASVLLVIYEQRDPAVPISDDDGGCNFGSVFICANFIINKNNYYTFSPSLNYTGGTLGNSYSQMTISNSTIVSALQTTDRQPALNLQSQTYYWGLWVQNGTSRDPVQFYVSMNPPTTATCGFCSPAPKNSMLAAIYIPPTVTPRLDTGGFFGPVIRALTTIAVIGLNYIAQFLGFVADAFVTGMNAVGSFFGLGNVGTAIRDFLTGVSNFIINVVTTVFGWGVTFASLFQNGISFIANFLSGSNGFIAWIISFFTTIAGIWTIVQDFWNIFTGQFVRLILTMNQILVFWYIVGMFWVYMDGWPGFKNWIDLTDTLILKLLRGAWWIGRETTTVVLDVKRFLAQWL